MTIILCIKKSKCGDGSKCLSGFEHMHGYSRVSKYSTHSKIVRYLSDPPLKVDQKSSIGVSEYMTRA
jgi:hypothetical protein